MKKPPDCSRAALSLFQVCLSFSHDPDRSNHKGSLLRKKEDNNQDNDDVKGLYEVHFGFLSKTKKPPVVGRLVFLYVGVLTSLSPLPSQPHSGP
jgi:hypothetical protein